VTALRAVNQRCGAVGSQFEGNFPRYLIESLLCLINTLDQIVSLELDRNATGTGDFVVRLDPSNRFLVFLAAFRARNGNGLMVENS
jgi:hypothetical protein